MATETKKSHRLFRPYDAQGIAVNSAATSRTISELVNEAVRLSLAEDAAELAAFEERAKEPVVSFADVLKDLTRTGRI
jgi:hypothetical protein